MRVKRLAPLLASAAVMAVLVVLIPSGAAASGSEHLDTATNATSGAPVTLTVTIVGEGSVVSYPAGISCGSTCSAQFPDGTYVSLDPVAANGYTYFSPTFSTTPPFSCLPYDIHDPLPCGIALNASLGTAASVQATFTPYSPPPPPCTAPGVQGKDLASAEALLARTHCGVGKIRYVYSLKVQQGCVISQNPKPHWRLANGTVDLVVGKGRRRSRHG
jgi:hypothetical protein